MPAVPVVRRAAAARRVQRPRSCRCFRRDASTAFKPNDWNTFEVLVDANVFRASVNAPAGGGLAIDAETGTFGPVALYVGGTGEVRFKNLALKDLQRRVTPAEKSSPHFRAQHFEDFYYGWSAAAGDFNHDGVLDVTMGNRYYLGPAFTDVARVLSRAGVQPGEGVRSGDGELSRATTPATDGTTSSSPNRARRRST